MGSAISAFRDFLTNADDKAKADILQQLNFLTTMANAKLDKYQSEMEQDFLTSDLRGKTSIAGHRAMRWERGYRVGVSKQASNGINEIIDAFFGDKSGQAEQEQKGDKKEGDEEKPDSEKGKEVATAGKKPKMEDPVLKGFKKVVGLALDVILGNVQVGEQEDIKYFVFARHNAVIRVDLRLWRYNFVGRGVMAQADNVFCYIFCTSVVRHETMIVDEIVYLMSEHGGDENVHAYLERLLVTWTMMNRIWSQYEKKELDKKTLEELPARPKLVAADTPPDDEVLTDLSRTLSTVSTAGPTAGASSATTSGSMPVGPSTTSSPFNRPAPPSSFDHKDNA